MANSSKHRPLAPRRALSALGPLGRIDWPYVALALVLYSAFAALTLWVLFR